MCIYQTAITVVYFGRIRLRRRKEPVSQQGGYFKGRKTPYPNGWDTASIKLSNEGSYYF